MDKYQKFRFLIYADDYITWNPEKNDWNHNDEFIGNYLDAHKYARLKYGKRYTIKPPSHPLFETD